MKEIPRPTPAQRYFCKGPAPCPTCLLEGDRWPVPGYPGPMSTLVSQTPGSSGHGPSCPAASSQGPLCHWWDRGGGTAGRLSTDRLSFPQCDNPRTRETGAFTATVPVPRLSLGPQGTPPRPRWGGCVHTGLAPYLPWDSVSVSKKWAHSSPSPLALVVLLLTRVAAS